jgi:hypothetical protein
VTKINIYCLFDKDDNFCGVYSSLKAIHRDAIALCNKSSSNVRVKVNGQVARPTLSLLRNVFKGEMNVKMLYTSGAHSVKILKTKLIE